MGELSALSDEELQSRLIALRKAERFALGELLSHLAEMDRRWHRLSLAQPSLFMYCTRVLGYSEGAAYKRIRVARVFNEFPRLRAVHDEGKIHLAGLHLLAPHLTPTNFEDMVERATGKTKAEIEFIVAAKNPRPDAPDSIRIAAPSALDAEPAGSMFALPASGEILAAAALPPDPAAAAASVPPSPPEPQRLSPWERLATRHVIEPLSATRVKFTFTGGLDLLDLVKRAQDLLRHKYPAGDLERILGDALDALLERKDPDRRLKRLKEDGRRAPDPGGCDPYSRRIPQAVRDEVWRRDGGQCSRVGPDGARCPERGGLEFDHVVPHALGGPSNDAKNIRLLCRAHNRLAAVRLFGDAVTRHWARRTDA